MLSIRNNPKSYLLAILLSAIVTFFLSFGSQRIGLQINENKTTWDALGYYMYLPAILIYQDYKKLEWYPKIEEKYKLQGDKFYQANKFNENFVFKYLSGISILQSPFFYAANFSALRLGYLKDGFSKPYQIAIQIAALFYFLAGFYLLAISLKIYFSETIVFWVLISIGLATNLIQYVSIDSGSSHIYIFFLYSLVIYLSIKFHSKPSILFSFVIGCVVGLASICRPTDLLMFLIPLLWSVNNKESFRLKLKFIKQNFKYLIFSIAGVILFSAPQLFYWYQATGSLIYDVGSKWNFLNPWWRVLFGIEKGWLLYTPVCTLILVGFFYSKKHPFHYSLLIFSLLNIWIVISWSDWRYGATYSCRALVQSYPIMAFGLASGLAHFFENKYNHLLKIGISFLVVLNLTQVYQYNKGIIHHNDMNWNYYRNIFCKIDVTAYDLSLLDDGDIRPFRKKKSIWEETLKVKELDFSGERNVSLFTFSQFPSNQNNYLFVKLNLSIKMGFWDGKIICKLYYEDKTAITKSFRLNNINTQIEVPSDYEFFVKPSKNQSRIERIELNILNNGKIQGSLNNVSMQLLD